MNSRAYPIALALLVILASAPRPASAATLTFFGENLTPGGAVSGDPVTARTNFLNALSGVSTEDFESFTPGQGPNLALSFTGSAGTINGTLSGADGQVRNAPVVGLFATSGQQYWDNEFDSFDVSFGFATPIAAFGFFATDIGDVLGQLTLTLTLAAGGTQEIVIPHTIDGPSGSLLYFGVIDAENPFTSVSFTGSSTSDRFGFDDLTVGDVGQVSVPEPGTLILLGLGLAGLGLGRKRKTQA